jgi:uncharacterized delta-60 repeat protein
MRDQPKEGVDPPERGGNAESQARAMRRASLATLVVGGVFLVASQLHLSLVSRVVGALAVTSSLLRLWYVEYRPHFRRIAGLSAAQWAAGVFSFAVAVVGLSALLFIHGASAQRWSVPQHVAGLLAIGPGGEYAIGATGTADGVPGTVVLRVRRDGSLDPTFGGGGIAFHRVGVGDAEVDSVLATADGGVVVSGTEASPQGGTSAFVGRLRANGSAERRFFTEEVHVDPGSEALVLRQAPTRFLVGATSRLDAGDTTASYGSYETHNTFGLSELRNTGSIDRSYGEQGFVIGPIECGRAMGVPCHPLRALLLRRNGSVVVASTFITQVGRDERLSPTSTGLTFGTPSGGWSSLAADSAGRVLAGGTEADGTHAEPEFLVARFGSTLEFDPTFGKRGVARIDLPADKSEVGGMAPLASGKILVAGRSATYDRDGLAVTRLDADGRLDPSFGSAGVVILHPLRVVRPLTRKVSTAIAVDPDGRIVVAEVLAPAAGVTTGGGVAMVRLMPTGKLDRSFGKDGVASWGLDFRSIEVEKTGDEFIGGLHQSPVNGAWAFKYKRLGVLCRGSSTPLFTCRSLDRRRRTLLEVRLSGTGKPEILRRTGSCCTTSTIAWRRAKELVGGDSAWIRTAVGALYCTALDAKLVCSNGSRHGFLLTESRVKAW